MPSDNVNKDDMPLDEEQKAATPDDGAESAEWTMTEEEIREIRENGVPLADVIREIKAQYGV